MKNARKKLSTLLILTLVVALLAACGSNSNNNSNNSSNNSSSQSGNSSSDGGSQGSSDKLTPVVDDDPVNLTFWYALSGANGERVAALVEEFNNSQDRITVEAIYSGNYADTATKMAAALASKTEPHVALMAAGSLYSYNRTKLYDMMQSDDEFDMDDIYPGMWEYGTYNGEINAIPFNISTQLLYFNKTIVEQAGIDPNVAPATWDDLYDYAKKIADYGKANGRNELEGIDTSDAPWTFKAMLMQNENNIIDPSGDDIEPLFHEESGVETAEFWAKLVQDGLMPATQHDLAENKFLSGNLGMLLASSARTSRWASGIDIEIGAWPLPAQKKASVPLGGAVLVQFNKVDRKDWAAYEFIKFLTSKEVSTNFALDSGYLPIRKSALDMEETKQKIESNPIYKVALDQLEHSWAYWNFDEMGSMDFMIHEALEKIEKGTATPAQAMEDLTKALNAEMGK